MAEMLGGTSGSFPLGTNTRGYLSLCHLARICAGNNDGMLQFVFTLYALLALVTNSVLGHSDYHERLNLQPLPLGSLLASFDFRSNETLSAFEQQNFRFFPRSLGQILQHAHTKELHLRFTTGRWDAAEWGSRPWNGTKEGGTGVELWAWIDAATEEEYVVWFQQLFQR